MCVIFILHPHRQITKPMELGRAWRCYTYCGGPLCTLGPSGQSRHMPQQGRASRHASCCWHQLPAPLQPLSLACSESLALLKELLIGEVHWNEWVHSIPTTCLLQNLFYLTKLR